MLIAEANNMPLCLLDIVNFVDLCVRCVHSLSKIRGLLKKKRVTTNTTIALRAQRGELFMASHKMQASKLACGL
jgi:hypothetical protein